jgi:hypothetical protein
MRALIAILLLLAGPGAAHAATDAWNFRVLLDGREVGRHEFRLAVEGQQRELRSEAEFNVRLLFINVYSYLHEAVERWQGDCLQSLESQTDSNGKRTVVSAANRGGRLSVVRAKGRDEHEGCVMSFAYWNPEILNARELLNSQTGELVAVTITEQGPEMIPVRGEPRAATRHRISAEQLQIDLWYAGGQWVALEALAPGGRRLRYELL